MGLFDLFNGQEAEDIYSNLNEEGSKKPDQVVQTSKKAGPAKMAKSGSAGPGGGKAPKGDSVTPTDTKRGKSTYGSSPNAKNRDKTGDIVNAKGVKGKVKK